MDASIGVAQPTVRIAVTDAVQVFTDAQLRYNGQPVQSVLITCELFDIRFGLGGAVPTQGVNGLGHILYTRQSISLENINDIRTFSFINHTNASNAALQATFRY